MSAAVPSKIRDQIKEKLWAKADSLQWTRLSDNERADWYQNWTKDADIGGKLAHFMDPRKVRVYIKDSLLKPYMGTRKTYGQSDALRIAVSDEAAEIVRKFSKPDGVLLRDGRVICWGNSRDWKAILIAVFERAHLTADAKPYAAVLNESGRTIGPQTRALVLEAGKRLEIAKTLWFD